MISDGKRKAALDALTAYADELRTEIERQTARLKRELASVEESMRLLAGRGAQHPGPQGIIVPPGVGGKYAGVNPQAAVERFLTEHPGQAFLPSEMAAALKAEGFAVSNPKLATQQVSIALGRVVGKELAEIESRAGRKAYRSITPQGGTIGPVKESE